MPLLKTFDVLNDVCVTFLTVKVLHFNLWFFKNLKSEWFANLPWQNTNIVVCVQQIWWTGNNFEKWPSCNGFTQVEENDPYNEKWITAFISDAFPSFWGLNHAIKKT